MSESVDRFLAERLQATHPKGRVLDLPAGDGELSKLLDSQGYEVVPADLFPEALRWEGREAVAADMNERLPFDDGEFDIVVSQEGVEHLENPAAFFREARRVLRPGGIFILTTPNFMDLSSRLAFFLTGMKSFHSGYANEQTTMWQRDGDRIYHGHAFSLPFFQIRYLLRVSDFGGIQLRGLNRSGGSTLLSYLLNPFSWFLIRRAFRRLEKKEHRKSIRRTPDRELQSELSAAALSRELLGFRKICVSAIAE